MTKRLYAHGSFFSTRYRRYQKLHLAVKEVNNVKVDRNTLLGNVLVVEVVEVTREALPEDDVVTKGKVTVNNTPASGVDGASLWWRTVELELSVGNNGTDSTLGVGKDTVLKRDSKVARRLAGGHLGNWRVGGTGTLRSSGGWKGLGGDRSGRLSTLGGLWSLDLAVANLGHNSVTAGLGCWDLDGLVVEVVHGLGENNNVGNGGWNVHWGTVRGGVLGHSLGNVLSLVGNLVRLGWDEVRRSSWGNNVLSRGWSLDLTVTDLGNNASLGVDVHLGGDGLNGNTKSLGVAGGSARVGRVWGKSRPWLRWNIGGKGTGSECKE